MEKNTDKPSNENGVQDGSESRCSDLLAFIFVYSPRNVDDPSIRHGLKCLTAAEVRKQERQMLKDGWENTAILNACEYIEHLANNSDNIAPTIADLF